MDKLCFDSTFLLFATSVLGTLPKMGDLSFFPGFEDPEDDGVAWESGPTTDKPGSSSTPLTFVFFVRCFSISEEKDSFSLEFLMPSESVIASTMNGR
jgi:hypothetical protein